MVRKDVWQPFCLHRDLTLLNIQFCNHFGVDYNQHKQMFLSKKNAEYLNKPSKTRKIEARVLPGWGDDEESDAKTHGIAKNAQTNLLGETSVGEVGEQVSAQRHSKQVTKKMLFNWDQLNDMNNIECEKRLVESIVEPVGVKVKPTQNLLTEFVKQSKSMDPVIVGSLLLSKLEVNYPFLVKAKSLYTIEHLIKKNQAFLNYFKSQTENLQNYPEPEDNVDSYRKILKSVLNYIGVSSQKTELTHDTNAISFVDPGYNDPKEESQIRGFLANNQKVKKPVGPGAKKFISPSDAKKGPSKKQDVFDIFSEEKQPSQKKGELGYDDLLFTNQAAVKNNNITFEDLLK